MGKEQMVAFIKDNLRVRIKGEFMSNNVTVYLDVKTDDYDGWEVVSEDWITIPDECSHD